MNATKPRMTARKIMQQVHVTDARAAGVSLRKGSGYWYFTGGIADKFQTQAVMVRRVNDLDLNNWRAEFKGKADRYEDSLD